jgi:D-alanyl-D-alanine carboxypeptidase
MHTVNHKPARAHRKKRTLWLKAAIILMLVFFLAAAVVLTNGGQTKLPAITSPATVKFNKSQFSVNDPSSIWVVVNKGRVLPNDYIPSDLVVPKIPLRLSDNQPEMQLRQAAADALDEMVGSASAQNIHLMLASGYRSYKLQVTLYGGYVRAQGQGGADSSSARPGHSEHQTGLAADIEPFNKKCEVQACFADTTEGEWLAANAYKYGFIIRYQKGQENLTGYEYEPWHVRYVGKDLAAQIYKSGKTLEQFFGLPEYIDYPTSPYKLEAGR